MNVIKTILQSVNYRAYVCSCLVAWLLICNTVLVQSSEAKHRIAGNCGAQCLYTLLVAEEAVKIDYGRFLDQYPVCRNANISLADLDQIAVDNVINGELIRFDPSKDLPAYRHLIAHVKPDHFVLLSRSAQGLWYCVDPPSMPYVLTEGVTATLSGNALAVGARDKTWPWISIISLMVFAIVLILIPWRRILKFHRISVVAVSVVCCCGCSSKDDARSSTMTLPNTFAFSPSHFDFGSVQRSDSPIVANLRIVGLTPDDQPKLTTSCGCAGVSLGDYDARSKSRAVAVRIVPESIESGSVRVVAHSAVDSSRAMAEIQYLVTNQVTVQSERPTFQNSKDPAVFAGLLEILKDPEKEVSGVSVLLATEQIEAGIDWQCYEAEPNKFAIEILNSEGLGYQHAYLQVVDNRGKLLHPEIPIEWGELGGISITPRIAQLSFAGRSCYIMLHSDRKIPTIQGIQSTITGVKVDYEFVDSNIVRITASFELVDSQPLAPCQGVLKVEFTDDNTIEVPLSVTAL